MNIDLFKSGVKTGLALTLTFAALRFATPASGADTKATEALALQLPAPTLKGTPEDLPLGPNIEPLSDKPRPAFLVPKGVKNVSAGKPVTSSVKPFTGEVNQLTDGKKEAFDYDAVEMKKGSQWVQVDLGEAFTIYAVVLWHDHRYIQVMRDVIVQVSDDPEFKNGVTTVFNNDIDNSSGLGVGADREYFETHAGKIVDGKGAKGRHVRTYTKGGSLSALNCWQEIEVYGLPAAKSAGVVILPTTASVAEPPAPVEPAPTVTIVAPGPAEPKPENVPVAPTVAQTTPKPGNAPQVPAQPAPAVAATFVNNTSLTINNVLPATGFDWTWPIIAASALVLLALGAFVVIRNSQASPLAKAK